MTTGRYAPSPSGRMHLGNLMCCLLAWLSAKSKGGQVLLRIEDLDAQRCPRRYADAIIDDLAWLGLAADGPEPPVYQSERSAVYAQYFEELARRGLVYPCFCSRSQLHAASAPHRSDGQVVYAGTCRSLTPAEIAERAKTRAPAWRVRMKSSPLRTATWAPAPRIWPETAGIFTCAGRTACLPTSWRSLWTMP